MDGGDSAEAVLLLAHGAGAGMDHQFMADIAQQLSCSKLAVVRFEFDYMVTARANDKRRPPDRLPKLQACYDLWVAAAQQHFPQLPLFIGGKSMGGRVACVCADKAKVSAAFALGYPFHPVGKNEPEKWRWQPLQHATAPLHIIQGSRDTFGNRVELEQHILPNQVTMTWLEDGDHSFKPRKVSGFTQHQHIQQAAQLIRAAIFRG
ncbi:alpha/beta hydrolase [Ferrimonas lipolytica]|uniref:Alpha/beta hydrolase n=1 Tax=Ferrimonas lipolytica TaxID=2724191 RepID=A0A6H1UJS6_9GAMM|nr:alpha/beta hydrolase [Ferrimonas lipolytica]